MAPRLKLSLIVIAAVMLAVPAGAGAGNGGVEPPSVGTGPGGSGSKDKTKQGGSKSKGARLRSMRASPRKSYFFAKRRPRLEFELRGKRRRDVIVTAVRSATATPVRSWRLDNVRPGSEPVVRWGGRIPGHGVAPRGAYEWVIANADGSGVDTSRAATRTGFNLFDHTFPVHGPHFYGDGLGAGRGHRGFDIAGDCGTRIVAARGGVVKHRAFQAGGAGFYLVVDGAGTKRDYVYMHLKRRDRVAEGERVRTGQTLGYMGSTGRSTGCHLHLEVWSGPGWASGGDFLDAERMARVWDSWGRFTPATDVPARPISE